MSPTKLFFSSFFFFFAVLCLLCLATGNVSLMHLTPLLSLGVFAALQAVVMVLIERHKSARELDTRLAQ